MSNHVTSLLRKRHLGVGLTQKAILLLMGDLASDDGSGIWASKPTMAAELETTDRTIRRAVEELSELGFIAETGRKKHRNGFTIEYAINIEMVEKCPKKQIEDRTDRPGSTQDVGGEIPDMTPDTPSPLTERPPTPDTPSAQDRTHRPPNQKKPSKNLVCPQATHTQDRKKQFEKFWKTYPRAGDREETKDLFSQALDAGADPDHIQAAAEAYREEQKGNAAQYQAYSHTWLSERRWERFDFTKTEPPDRRTALKPYADGILKNQPFMIQHISVSKAREMIALGMVTEEQAASAGVI